MNYFEKKDKATFFIAKTWFWPRHTVQNIFFLFVSCFCVHYSLWQHPFVCATEMFLCGKNKVTFLFDCQNKPQAIVFLFFFRSITLSLLVFVEVFPTLFFSLVSTKKKQARVFFSLISSFLLQYFFSPLRC